MRNFVGHPRARRSADDGDGGEERAAGGWRRRPRAGEDPWAVLWREVDRSRRHHHELVLVRLGPPARGRGDRRLVLGAAAALRAATRSVDVLWVADETIFMLLPESDRAAAEGLLRRVGGVIADLAPDGPRLACFPQDGLTANALRAAVGARAATPTALPVGAARAIAREHEPQARREASG